MATRIRVGTAVTKSMPPGNRSTISGLSLPSQMPRLADLSRPSMKRRAVNNIVAVHDMGTKAEKQEGDEWYPKVNEATAKGVKQLGLPSMMHGAGIVSAVSPNMDFENNNIHAFGELSKFHSNPEHVAVLHRSLANVVPSEKNSGRMVQKRTPEMSDVLKQYPNIAKAPDVGIYKAGRLMNHEDPDTVINPRSAYKTNSFMHHIADPSMNTSPHTGRPMATMDGRAHDIGANNMMTWGTDRGIGSSGGKKPSRGEEFADSYERAGKVIGAEESKPIPNSAVQARTWVIGKRLEKSMPGARRSSATREVIGGPKRVGQPYSPR